MSGGTKNSICNKKGKEARGLFINKTPHNKLTYITLKGTLSFHGPISEWSKVQT